MIENRYYEKGKKLDKNMIEAIQEQFNKMSKGQKMIANYIMDHYEQAAFLTAAKLGKAVGVSESTVVRFAGLMGYDGYGEFQEALATWIQNKLHTVQRNEIRYNKKNDSEILKGVLKTDAQNILDTLGSIDSDAFKSAVDMIMNARKVFIVGIRTCSPLAQYLAFYLNMVRDQVIVVNSSNASEMFEQMIRLNTEDTVIGISFPRYSIRTLKAMEFANERNAKLIAITDSEYSPMNMYASCKLLAKSNMISIADSLVAPMSVINALVVALCMKNHDEVNNNLKELEDVWENYQVYIKDEIAGVEEPPKE